MSTSSPLPRSAATSIGSSSSMSSEWDPELGLTISDQLRIEDWSDEIETNFTLEDLEEVELLTAPQRQPRYRTRDEQARTSSKIVRTKPRQSEW